MNILISQIHPGIVYMVKRYPETTQPLVLAHIKRNEQNRLVRRKKIGRMNE